MAKCCYTACPGLSDHLICCEICKKSRFHNNCAIKAKSFISFGESGNTIYCYQCQKTMMETSRINTSVVDTSMSNMNSLSNTSLNASFISPVNGSQLLDVSTISNIIETNISKQFVNFKNELMNEVRNVIVSEIKAVADDVSQLKKEVSTINNKVAVLEKNATVHGQHNIASVSATIAHEVRDINSKINNVIMFGVPELSTLSADSQIDSEDRLLLSIFSKIKNFSPKILKYSRFLKSDRAGIRPIVVTFESRSDVFNLLKFANMLPNNIKVKIDKTKNQREYLSSLYKIKDRYVTNNPSDPLSVKHINDVPQLVDNLGKIRSPSDPKSFL